jgi:hypothetical protein
VKPWLTRNKKAPRANAGGDVQLLKIPVERDGRAPEPSVPGRGENEGQWNKLGLK